MCILYIYNDVILSTTWHLAIQNVGRLEFRRVSMMLAEPNDTLVMSPPCRCPQSAITCDAISEYYRLICVSLYEYIYI